MNIDFEAALRYIDLGNYDTAIVKLRSAIAKEEEANNRSDAAQYRCVLGELFANLRKVEESREEFNKVIDYCDETHTLAKQREIAQTYLDAFDGKLPIPEQVKKSETEQTKRPGYIPLVPKPVQDRGFIAKQSRKKHK